MEEQPLKAGADRPPPYSTATASMADSSRQMPPSYHNNQYPGSASWPLPPGYYPNNADGNHYSTPYVPTYGSMQSFAVTVPQIIVVGGCPACREGIMEDDYTWLGLLCALLFFPLGIICCLLLKTRRCSNCGAYFG